MADQLRTLMLTIVLSTGAKMTGKPAKAKFFLSVSQIHEPTAVARHQLGYDVYSTFKTHSNGQSKPKSAVVLALQISTPRRTAVQLDDTRQLYRCCGCFRCSAVTDCTKHLQPTDATQADLAQQPALPVRSDRLSTGGQTWGQGRTLPQLAALKRDVSSGTPTDHVGGRPQPERLQHH